MNPSAFNPFAFVNNPCSAFSHSAESAFQRYEETVKIVPMQPGASFVPPAQVAVGKSDHATHATHTNQAGDLDGDATDFLAFLAQAHQRKQVDSKAKDALIRGFLQNDASGAINLGQTRPTQKPVDKAIRIHVENKLSTWQARLSAIAPASDEGKRCAAGQNSLASRTEPISGAEFAIINKPSRNEKLAEAAAAFNRRFNNQQGLTEAGRQEVIKLSDSYKKKLNCLFKWKHEDQMVQVLVACANAGYLSALGRTLQTHPAVDDFMENLQERLQTLAYLKQNGILEQVSWLWLGKGVPGMATVKTLVKRCCVNKAFNMRLLGMELVVG